MVVEGFRRKRKMRKKTTEKKKKNSFKAIEQNP